MSRGNNPTVEDKIESTMDWAYGVTKDPTQQRAVMALILTSAVDNPDLMGSLFLVTLLSLDGWDLFRNGIEIPHDISRGELLSSLARSQWKFGDMLECMAKHRSKTSTGEPRKGEHHVR